MSDAAPKPGADRAVVAAVLAGDRDAYAELVQRYAPRVYRALYRMVGDAAEAEELTQETMVRAFFALSTFDPSHRFAPWLYQIAANLSINHARKRQREPHVGQDAAAADRFFESVPDPDRTVAPAPASEAAEVRARLRRAFETLPRDAREILVMRHVMELSYQEICEATGLPIGTVKSRLERARRRLAEAFGAE